MGFEEAMDAIARGVEILGIVTLVLGLAAALVRAGLALLGGQGANEGYRIVRTVFGRSILLGLEFLVAADIIRTVAVQPLVLSGGRQEADVELGVDHVLPAEDAAVPPYEAGSRSIVEQ